MTASFDIVMFNHNPYPLFQYSVNKFWQRYSHNLNSQIIASSWTITRVLLKRYKQYIGTDQILNVTLFDGDFSSYGSSFSTSNICCVTHFLNLMISHEWRNDGNWSQMQKNQWLSNLLHFTINESTVPLFIDLVYFIGVFSNIFQL